MTTLLKTEGDKPNTFGWLQFEKKGLNELRKLSTKSPMAMTVLLYLATNMSRTNAIAISQKAISKNAGISLRAVAGAVKILNEHNFLETIKVGNLSIYRINTRLAWQGNRGERYAHFTADIIAIEEEQTGGTIENMTPLNSVPVSVDNERIYVQNNEIDPPDQHELDLP